MNKLRQKFFDDQMTSALTRAITAQEGYLQPDTRVTVTAILMGAAVASRRSVDVIKTLDRLWGTQGSAEKASRLLETWALRLLSTWLAWLDGNRPEDERRRARESWGEILLNLFDDLSEDNLSRFLGRDLQHRYERARLEEGEKSGEKRTILVGTSLIISDVVVALGGQALFQPTPITGYPYDSTRDLIERGGAKELSSTADPIVDTFLILDALNAGAKVCADNYREASEEFEEQSKAIFTQLRQLLAEGHTLGAIRADASWATWVQLFEERGMLEVGK